ncbi:hypothetical protein IXB28_12295 [Leptothoe kymatousa TAU-MAC 1615]|uniref:Ubiquinone biosynthesis protein n=2 Tax=Leptothoe TaxID=2651725 RepID=A0ABS5Y593_9CYAN|nr:hypothetical protein [Leptothoe kymatousa TAU-MAC 1615]
MQAGLAGRAGDTAAYKAAALGTQACGTLNQRLATLANPLPHLDLMDLRAQPPGSFGHALANFLDRYGLQPLTLSAAAQADIHGASLLAVRYPILHDAFHVLLGFDTSLAGELGVWSFVAAQKYCGAFERAAWVGKWFTRLLIPWQWRRLRHYEEKGQQLGRNAVCIIAEPLEDFWPTPLDEVRRRLNLPVQI